MREQLQKCLAAIEAAEAEIHKTHDPYSNKQGDKVYPHERPEQVRDANGRFLLADYAIAKAQILIALSSLPPEWTSQDRARHEAARMGLIPADAGPWPGFSVREVKE